MIVIDTSIWIDFLKAREPVFSRMQGLLENGQVLAVECVFAELMQGTRENRESEIISDYWHHYQKILWMGFSLKQVKNLVEANGLLRVLD